MRGRPSLIISIDAADIEMVAEPTHCLGFPADVQTGGAIQFLSLDKRKGDITVVARVLSE